MRMGITVIGGASVDTIIQLDTFPEPTPQTIWPRAGYRSLGSTGAGKALNLAALDIPVTLHTLLGRDAEGQFIRDALQHRNITLLAEETDAGTEQHVNLMDANGDRISLFVNPSTEPDAIDWRDVRTALAHSELAVINILAYARPALELARAAGKPIWTDLHDYDGKNSHHQPFVDAAEVVFLSSDKLPDYRHFMQQQIHKGKSLVVCTHGSCGATLIDSHGQWIEQPAFPAPNIEDTNGAGDAFFSGFLYGYLDRQPLATCMKLGAACGALCVGARSLAAPTLSREYLQSRLTGAPTSLD
ncbi:PfkB family carbohydrate kinase [Marinobacter nanhaiticus D15-8W]|uniref:Carbohydrate kinase family protein n=2 Tax=Marinobacter TaxID=2742 RepID=N6W8D1_9GAMM|nr:carbohydrate kinase family protein [Marinobacter nanhaiticus D15-8W]BES72325.1 PfkB family carbohydrate kinase [Marinobacter nanhaiticus D15-8W]